MHKLLYLFVVIVPLFVAICEDNVAIYTQKCPILCNAKDIIIIVDPYAEVPYEPTVAPSEDMQLMEIYNKVIFDIQGRMDEDDDDEYFPDDVNGEPAI